MARKSATIHSVDGYTMETNLRSVDLNLLTVFDAVMQEQNITRAAHNLGMSQPAVSNAVARLKVMFNDELFIRHGRGIQPTQRAKQLFGPLRQALQLVKNELPASVFCPQTSNRTFKLAISSPSDIRFVPAILRTLAEQAPNVRVQIETESDAAMAEKMQYQNIDFVIDYARFDEPGMCSTALFHDELVVVAAGNHPRLGDTLSTAEFEAEKHAVLKTVPGVKPFAETVYHEKSHYAPAYQGTSLSNVLYVTSQSELIAVVPRWLATAAALQQSLKILPLPFESGAVSGYLSWHESSQKDKGHLWMRDQLLAICGSGEY